MRDKRRFVIPGLAALALVVGLASPTHAAIILDTTSAEFLGTISPDVPAGEAQEASYVNFLIGLPLGTSDDFSGQTITRSNNDPGGGVYPAAVFEDKIGDDNTFTLPGDYTYMLGKYDAHNAGAWVWYIAGLPAGTEVEIPSTFNGLGLSHVSFFTEFEGGGEDTVVPEPASLLLLGFGALIAGRRARRRFAA